MALRIALLPMYFLLCVAATRGKEVLWGNKISPLHTVNESFCRSDVESCVTALACLWLEVAQLPRRRMVERINAIFKQFQREINVSSECARLEMDETFANIEGAQSVLRDVREKLNAALALEAKIGERKDELLLNLASDEAVVVQMNDALLSIQAVAIQVLPIQAQCGKSQFFSLSTVKADVSTMKNFVEEEQSAKRIVASTISTLWEGNVTLLIETLKEMVKISVEIIDKKRNNDKKVRIYSNSSKAIRVAREHWRHLANYMDTIGSVDKFCWRQRNVSDNIASQLLGKDFAKQLEGILSDMNALKTTVKQMRKERSRLALVKQKKEEERRHSCTDLWNQLLTLVKLK
ncbi:hypothetical protein ERJ75_001584200 [Trypanosoma vivax]|uniref:Uncharacterized protein n=1 Tax=Trypanosoma vivax (strain Y486) TaxID=1055687 RepID=F9WNT3_TRYVY|nr:hypothetical protein TRVL_05870 [Trypanosoma vivax]KAH8605493.1 hypothetical protein ERJ75_001584200 [Trypanosoma vivax]CCD19204.1 hypothetical protein, conserved in T.vivax [Trypanosoma vivax Y486]|eukprot:CCD19204.1 hypothetical protein, conserved in T.vivax [Trypanosoma vivax Y486]